MERTDVRKAFGFMLIVVAINAIWNGSNLPEHLEFIEGSLLGIGALLFFTTDEG